MKKVNLIRHLSDRAFEQARYQEILREGTMSAGVYILRAGETDPQRPHAEDEMYYIIAGEARFYAGEDHTPVEPGDVIFVPAGIPHKFYEITQDLVILVVFAPPESG